VPALDLPRLLFVSPPPYAADCWRANAPNTTITTPSLHTGQILVPIALAASADAAMAFAPASSFTAPARRSVRVCGAARPGARLRPAALKMAAGEWQEIFDETYKAPYWWNVKTGETTWEKPAALAAPAPPAKKAAAAKPAQETEEISQAEYEELLRLAGRAPAESATKPAAKQGGLFSMFGGGGAVAAPAAAKPASGGLISPVTENKHTWMRACMHACMRRYILTDIHTCIHAYVGVGVGCRCTYTRTILHCHTSIHTSICTIKYICAYRLRCTLTCMHTYRATLLCARVFVCV
jgi:hypothetical protein